jgi:GNAT superfamily N-acetyltransferase
MKTGQSWKVRDGDERDLENILSLRKVVFGEMEEDKLDPSYWKWQFMKGPDGKALIYVAEDEGRVIGHFADVPRRFFAHGSVVLGTLSIDLMVHPDYRRKGIFSELGRLAIERVKRRDGLFMMAYPIRKETIQGFKKIGWEVVTELPVIVCPIRFQGIVRRYLPFPLISHFLGGTARLFYFILFWNKGRRRAEGIEIEEVKEFDDQFDSFWTKALSLYPILGVRDRSYLTWRYLQHPTRTYIIFRAKKNGEMKGYIILRKVDLLRFKSAVIVDLIASDSETLSALVMKGIDQSRKEKVDLLGYMVPKGHPYHRILRQRGFLPSLKTFLLMVYPQSPKELLLSPERWYVNWGDTDVI